MALKVLDRSMQAFGAEGICQDQPLAQMVAGLRTLRYADVSSKALLHGSLDRPLRPFAHSKGTGRGTHVADRASRVETCTYAQRKEQENQGQAGGIGGQGQGKVVK